MERIKDKITKYRYPLIVLAVGLMLLVMPETAQEQEKAADAAQLLSQTLSAADGVGDVRVIISESGVLVVCEGANDANVRLDIIRAVNSYTGFGTDKITVLKMTY